MTKTSKWNRWKLIHKETGLSFNEFYRKYKVKDNDGELLNYKTNELTPCLLESGALAIYVDIPYYPYMFFLVNSEWEVVMKDNTTNKTDKED